MSNVGDAAKNTPQLAWLDRVKGVAIVWLFLNHLAEQLFGGPYLANPTANWGNVRQRIEQLEPLRGHGLANQCANILRYVGWGGDMAGVQLFIFMSGFGLAWSLVNKSAAATFDTLPFYRRRLARIYPEWVTVHVLFAAAGALSLVGGAPSFFQKSFWLSLIGVRFLPTLVYAFSPAWWFFGLLIQLYLVFPVLWIGLKRLGSTRMFAWVCVLGFAVRGAGLVTLKGYLDAWSRGAIFITQVPSFAFGVALAAWFAKYPGFFSRHSRAAQALLGLAIYLLGNILSLDLVGMTLGPFVIGIGALVMLWPAVSSKSQESDGSKSILTWVGRHSLSLFLVHHIAIQRLAPSSFDMSHLRFLARIAGSIVATILGAVLLEQVAQRVVAGLISLKQRFGAARAVSGATGVFCLLAILLVTVELRIRKTNPQEVLGWGELQSLQLSDEFGWQLKPSKTTRLRWLSYDYLVRSNSLGFSGPEYPRERQLGTIRMLITGDAYTSAEGVDTEQAWPRLLEHKLKNKSLSTTPEVLNFAITGYGPTQEAAIVDRFVPEYHPDLVILEMFINDFDDEIQGNTIRDSIGFENPNAQTSWKGVVKLSHLSAWLNSQMSRSRQLLFGKPSAQARFFGGLDWLERDSAVHRPDVRERVKTRLAQILNAVRSNHASVLVVFVPGAIQVCRVDELPYLARAHIDQSTLDLEGPQRFAKALCEELGIEFIDLRPVLNADRCLYQPANLHWLPEAHDKVAEFLAEKLQSRADVVAH
jgi:peptidoglycan/LPS O-acetylase OafA/YrhL/lysophospholipase L1-like esterase